ncbi:putative cell surface protein [Methanonatronarchaeum thermophilum]|uniref:Putative cell surface protein n=1 Tax=Methanonatronarchaeum thermophilum TaxID=1927129 RepID=A0A1Y3GDB4_9EURY|nr:hypothetical protein [Methanonatronarchaeum thermophilum]OUJ19389.1 putative cell surface protein [Methanonatronarchaeum thermophilum]
MKKPLFIIGILFLMILTIGAGTAIAETTDNELGTINGSVYLDQEHENTSIPNIDVTLHEYKQNDELNEVDTYNTTTNELGEYNFEDLNTSRFYQISSQHDNITYSSNMIEFDNETKTTENLTVHNSTDKTDDLIIAGQGHLVVIEKPDEGGLNIGEIIQFVNVGDKTFNGTLLLDIPQQAEILMTHPEMKTTDEGLELNQTETIKPGESSQFFVEYNLDVDIDEYQFEKEILYETQLLAILTEPDTINFGERTNLLESEQPVDMGETQYNALIAGASEEYGAVSIGDTVMVDLQEDSEIGLWVYLVVFGVILTSMVVYWKRDVLTSKINNSKTTGKTDGEKGILEQEKEEIFSKMDKLDKEHRNEEISDEEYRERMKELKKQAVDVMKKIEEKDKIK